jgi:hypothetical protein
VYAYKFEGGNMATLDSFGPATQASAAPGTTTQGFPAATRAFHWIASLLTGWFIFGLFIDGWAHNHGQVDNSFFTPWHAILYSGVLAISAHLTLTQYRNMQRGYTWARALPRGYGLSLAGVVVFFVGGGFDFVWHSLFGFEANLELLMSPAHLLLATGGFLFTTGPLRAAFLRSRKDDQALSGWADMFPVVFSLLVVFSLATFFTLYVHPFSNARALTITPTGNTDLFDVSGIAGVVIYTALLVGTTLLATRRWRLPVGTLFLVFGANAALMYWLRHNRSQAHLIGLLVGLGSALLGEVLFRALRPSATRPEALRIFAFGWPLVTFIGLFGTLVAGVGIGWSVHMWLGASFLGGVTGLFVSYLIVPPAWPAEDSAA